MFKDVINLIQIKNTRSKTGGEKPEVTGEREVFCDIKSVRSTEFYQAYQSGLDVTKLFVIYDDDYDDERVVKYQDAYFTVVRTYLKGELLELTCKKRNGLFQEVKL